MRQTCGSLVGIRLVPDAWAMTQGQHGELWSNLDLGSKEKVEFTGPSLPASQG